MAEISSANKGISVTPGKEKKPPFNAKKLVDGLGKDVRSRWTYVGIGGVVLLFMASTFVTGGAKKSGLTPAREASSVIDTSPKGMENNKDWRAKIGAEMAALQKAGQQQQSANKELLATVEKLRQELAQNQKARPSAPVEPRVNLTIPPPPEPPKSLTPPPVVAGGKLPVGSVTPIPASSIPDQQSSSSLTPANPRRAPARSFVPSTKVEAASTQEQSLAQEYVPNERKGFLPGGSFAAATMISGVDAFTGETARAQPQPLILRVDENAILPNAAKYAIKGCHLLASAWGDLSSERVFARTATLTCVDSSNRLVLSEEVEGTLVDSDGKNGIRGAVMDRQGAKLGRSLLAGFAEGLASAFGAAQATVSNTAFGSSSSVLSKDVPRVGAYQGAATAAEQLSDFYLKQAEATMPVIAVDAGRRVTVLFTKSKALKFETTEAYRTKPAEKLHVEKKVTF